MTAIFCASFCSLILSAEKPLSSFSGVDITSGAVYRGNLGRSGVFRDPCPVSVPKTVWKTSLGGDGKSSPVVLGGKLFIGAADGAYCLDAASGKQIWKLEIKGGVESSACVANDSVFFSTVAGELLCLDIKDGKVKWKYQGKAKEPVRSSPAAAYGAVFCALGDEIVALDMMKGKKIYGIKKNVPAEFCSLVLAQDAFYGCGVLNWGYLFSYDYETSEVKWKSNGPYVQGAGVYFYKSPCLDEEGNIYLNTTRGARKYSPTIKGDAARGQHVRLWYAFLLDKDVDDNELIPHASPSVWDGKVYCGRKDGKFFALDCKDGKVLWKKVFPGEIQSDPSISAKSGILVFGCYDGNLYALDASTGDEKWKLQIGGQVFASPWIGDGAIFAVSGDGTVFCLK